MEEIKGEVKQDLRNQAYVRDNLTPWEQQMLGYPTEAEEKKEEAETPTQEEKQEKSPAEEKKDEPVKLDAKAILEKLLKGERKEEEKANTNTVEVDEDDPLTKENAELKTKIQIIEESEKIEEILSAYPEKEAEVLKNRLVELLGSPIYRSLHGLPTEEKIASLITMAKGLASDEIKALAEDTAETKTLLRDATSTPNGKNKESDPEEVRVQELKKAARAGDRQAMIELQKYDPVLNRLSGK